MKTKTILFLQTGPAMPDLTGKIKSKYHYFSKYYSGLIISPVASSNYMGLKKIAKFDFFPFIYYTGNAFIRNIRYIYNVLACVLKYKIKKRIDVIVSPNPLLCGLISLILKKITGAKAIVEVNGNFEAAFKFGREGERYPKKIDRLKHLISGTIISFVLKRADSVKLVYKEQLVPLGLQNKVKATSFPNFVSINSFISAAKSDQGYILLLGYPWYLKGVDILIKAFNQISDSYPNMKLKVVGWCPNGREYFEELAGNNSQIELCDPVHYERVIPLMANCSIYVLASRTDSSPRVLREAMAACKPIIASSIDGVPELIIDGFNGLLFEKENVQELADKIKILIEDHALSNKLAQNGLTYVQQELSEDNYINKYVSMIDAMF